MAPDYEVAFYRDRKSVSENQVRYFVLSSKEPWGRYNAVTPEFYAWIVEHSHPVIEAEGKTFWRLGLYEWNGVHPASTAAAAMPETDSRNGA